MNVFEWLLFCGYSYRKRIILADRPEKEAELVVVLATWECEHRAQGKTS